MARRNRVLLVLLPVALVAASCGGSNEVSEPTDASSAAASEGTTATTISTTATTEAPYADFLAAARAGAGSSFISEMTDEELLDYREELCDMSMQSDAIIEFGELGRQHVGDFETVEAIKNTLTAALETCTNFKLHLDTFISRLELGATPTTTTTSTTTTIPTTTTTVFDPNAFDEIGARDYALFVKDPDSHVGEQIVIYGHITQFDSATGTDTFRADTAHAQQDDWYDYDVNTIITGSEVLLSEIVQDDIVKMWVTGLGSLTYDTSIGGSATVPLFLVHQIEVIGFKD